MLTLTSEYALRAMIHLSRHVDECPIPGRRIAESTKIPPKYLSSILGDLVRAGVLKSAPGIRGGFTPARPASEIMLATVFTPFEPFLSKRSRCPFEHGECDVRHPCAAHDRWKQVQASFFQYLDETSVADVTTVPPEDLTEGRT